MNINWVAVGALAAAVVAVGAVFQILNPPVPSIPLINPATLTAKIESYPYRHAATEIFEKRDLWREEWVQPLEQNLEELNLAPNVRETVVTAMERLIQEKYDLALERYRFGDILRARKWYDVTIRNDGDVPLKDVFLKFPQADYWIDDTDRLTYVPERIEIGDMDQKSEKRYVFWGEASGFLTERKPLLGHSNGIGSIDFD